jgi:hypothetical protein
MTGGQATTKGDGVVTPSGFNTRGFYIRILIVQSLRYSSSAEMAGGRFLVRIKAAYYSCPVAEAEPSYSGLTRPLCLIDYAVIEGSVRRSGRRST